MRKKKITFEYCRILIAVSITLVLYGMFGLSVNAAGVKVRQWVANDSEVKIYVSGADPATDGVSYQINDTAVNDISAYSVIDDSFPMRTVLMLDNSESTKESSRSKVSDVMKGIIEGHADREEFRLATFSDSASYLSNDFSNDYKLLESAVDSITYTKQATYLTDVLYEVIQQLNENPYMGYTRIIVISDGMDNKNIHVEKNDFYNLLDETPYPIYSIGTDYGSNGDELSNMFSISANTNAESCILEDTDTSDILSMIAQDNTLAVYEAMFPESAKKGGYQNSRLTLSDGTVLTFTIATPFADPSTQETVSPSEASSDETTAVEVQPEEITESERSEEKPFLDRTLFGIPVWILLDILIACIALAVILSLVVLQKRKNGRRKTQVEGIAKDQAVHQMVNGQDNQDDGYDGKTVFIGDDENSKTVSMIPGNDSSVRSETWQLTFRDEGNPANTYTCLISSVAHIGRKSENNIAIRNDAAVSGSHCDILVKNGMFFIRDVGSSNGTYLNGASDRMPSNVDQLIRSGDRVQIGRSIYVIIIEK